MQRAESCCESGRLSYALRYGDTGQRPLSLAQLIEHVTFLGWVRR